MRFNKSEVTALANQPSHKFEKEGVLFIKEKQDSFFRRNEVAVERWCRLRGNLLFYFKSRDHLSEPAGIIVIEDCKITTTKEESKSTFGITLSFAGGAQQNLATFTENDQESWVAALKVASHSKMKAYLNQLEQQLNSKLNTNQNKIVTPPNRQETVIDPNELPLLEISLSCDNLLCDSLGRPPSAKLVIYLRNPTHPTIWKRLAQTEVVEKSSNPSYHRTIVLRSSDDITDLTELRISAYDYREKFTSTYTQMGRTHITIEELKKNDHIRVKLDSPNGKPSGFVTINSWAYEGKNSRSTYSTPHHLAKEEKKTHKRSQSLPPNTRHYSQQPQHWSLSTIFANSLSRNYRFHSGLGGDINVQEMCAESRLSFTFPQQLLSLWICEEKELVHEIAGLGELRHPWHEYQMNLLESHLHIINTYSQALENLDTSKAWNRNLRKSSEKSDSLYEFVPVNLHLQRIWIYNGSLRKSSNYDIITHGAFTAMHHNSPGLIKMLKDLKVPTKDSNYWCNDSDRLQLAEDTLMAIRRVRKEVVDKMRILMKKAKAKEPQGMMDIVEEMIKKTRCLCNLLETSCVEEVFQFLEDNRITQRPQKDEFSESVAEFMQRNKLKIDLPLLRPCTTLSGLSKSESFQTPCTEFLSKELKTPDIDFYHHLYHPNLSSEAISKSDMTEFWRSYSAYTSGYQSVDRLSDIDEFEESFKYLSVMDKTKHYYTLCKTNSPLDTPAQSPAHSPKKLAPNNEEKSQEIPDKDDGIEEVKNEETLTNQDNQDATPIDNKSPNNQPTEDDKTFNDNLHYKAGDEPEPIELTHLNVEASMMCLASKVRFLTGKINSPTFCSRTFRFRDIGSVKKSSMPKSFSHDLSFKEPEEMDWCVELRPSMRKLRQGMDSLCKSARLVCSVYRLRQLKDAVNLSRDIKYRRDVCFSQALTSLVTSLMGKFWTEEPDLTFLSICSSIGPLISFESLLSLHGEDVSIFNDMLVAIEDLRNVEFSLILVDKKHSRKNRINKENVGDNLHHFSFPHPRVSGCRSCLKVMIPIPDYVYTLLPQDEIKNMVFHVTPVLFNVGVNEWATVAEKLGQNGPQEKNNLDNYKILSEYAKKFIKQDFYQASRSNNNKRGSMYYNEPELEDLLVILKNEVNNRRSKNVDILQLNAQISRRLLGIRFTCCKSGKDRTGMSSTLEEVQILSREFDLAEHEFSKALSILRSEGVRRDILYKNVGSWRYAFNVLQRAYLPFLYKPPAGTYGSSLT